MTFYWGSVTCDDAAPKNYQVWHGGCQTSSDPDDPIQVSVKYSCDATDGFHIEMYMNADCSDSPMMEMTALEVDTCNQGLMVTCGCAAGVGCAAPAPTPRPTVAPVPAPTPRPTLAPTVAPVTGAITFSGLSLADAQANEAVLVDAIADSAGVDKSRVSISIAATTRRRLSDGVIVTYSIATDTTADADALVTTLSALTTEDVNAALTTAAAEHGVAATFEAVTVTEVTVDEREDGALGSDAAAARGPLLATAVLGAAAAAL